MGAQKTCCEVLVSQALSWHDTKLTCSFNGPVTNPQTFRLPLWKSRMLDWLRKMRTLRGGESPPGTPLFTPPPTPEPPTWSDPPTPAADDPVWDDYRQEMEADRGSVSS